MNKSFHQLYTVIVLLANGYLELACPDMDLPEFKRHWLYVRTVDYSQIVLQ